MEKIKILLVLFILIFTRFYNLDKTGVFFWDQSRDLVNIHQYFLERKLTLAGPISEEGLRIFSSLTYYMLMPFAVIWNFDPISTTIGAAFFGLLTAILIIYMTKLINKKMILLIIILSLFWHPLIQVSRSAWNPYPIPFWIALGLIFYQFKNPFSLFLSGLMLGLTLHHHYLTVFATGLFILISAILSIKGKNFKVNLFLIAGYMFALLPFVIFDLRHPPGLFITRILYFNHIKGDNSLVSVIPDIWRNFSSVFFYYTHSLSLSVIVGILALIILINDLKRKSIALMYGLPFLMQVVSISIIADAFEHYFLPGLIFFLAWVIYPRAGISNLLSRALIIALIFGSFFTIIPQLTVPVMQPSIKSVREITNILEDSIRKDDLKNVNLVVLASEDNQTYGARYRDLLLIRDIRILSKYEYFTNDNLFVISESLVEKVRSDVAAEMYNFKKGLLKGKWNTSDGKWNIFLFERNIPIVLENAKD